MATKKNKKKHVRQKESSIDYSQLPAVTNDKSWFDPEAANWESLGTLAQRIFTIQCSNPGIPITSIHSIINKGAQVEVGLRRIYNTIDTPEYRAIVREYNKDEFDRWQEIQNEASKELRSLIRSKSERIRLEACKFSLSHTREIAIERAKLMMTRDIEEAKLKTPPPKMEVEVSFASDIHLFDEPLTPEEIAEAAGVVALSTAANPDAPPPNNPVIPDSSKEPDNPGGFYDVLIDDAIPDPIA